MPEVGIPCLVDPNDQHKLRMDWDAGYDLHEPAWQAHSAGAPERRVEAKEERRREDERAIARAEAAPKLPRSLLRSTSSASMAGRHRVGHRDGRGRHRSCRQRCPGVEIRRRARRRPPRRLRTGGATEIVEALPGRRCHHGLPRPAVRAPSPGGDTVWSPWFRGSLRSHLNQRRSANRRARRCRRNRATSEVGHTLAGSALALALRAVDAANLGAPPARPPSAGRPVAFAHW